MNENIYYVEIHTLRKKKHPNLRNTLFLLIHLLILSAKKKTIQVIIKLG